MAEIHIIRPFPRLRVPLIRRMSQRSPAQGAELALLTELHWISRCVHCAGQPSGKKIEGADFTGKVIRGEQLFVTPEETDTYGYLPFFFSSGFTGSGPFPRGLSVVVI